MEKEESIRKGVSNFFTERILNVIKSKPSINDELNNAVIIVANKTIDKLVIKGKKTIEDAYQNEQFFKNNPQGPTYLVRHIQGIQDEWLGGRKSYEIGYLKNMNQLKEDKINIPSFEESCIEILSYLQRKDNVIKTLRDYNFDINNFYPDYLKSALLGEYRDKKDYVEDFRTKMKASSKLNEIIASLAYPDKFQISFTTELIEIYERYFIQDEVNWIFN